ncbi:MAG: hypothetical protein WCJ45_05565 [bacterium]
MGIDFLDFVQIDFELLYVFYSEYGLEFLKFVGVAGDEVEHEE